MLGSRSVLIVEDEAFIAIDLAHVVAELGGRVVGPVASIAAAMRLLDEQLVAAAILDASLLDGDSTPVALRLVRENVPFVMHTGTGVPPDVAAVRPDLPVVMKPANPQVVIDLLVAEIHRMKAT